jgi:hypothetical protein
MFLVQLASQTPHGDWQVISADFANADSQNAGVFRLSGANTDVSLVWL